MSLFDVWDALKQWARHDEELHMKKIAQRYAERSVMDGAVVRKTGEIIPRESV